MAVESDQVWRSRGEPGATIGDDEPTADIPVDLPATGEEAAEGPARAWGESDPFEPGRVLCGRYELERVVGRGGSCVVLAARDLRRHAAGDDLARVAVKVLRPELRRQGEHRRRLTAEFLQLQQLSHPCIVRVFDLERQGDDWFLVMELLEGVSLAGLMQHCEGGQVPPRRALAIVRSCAEALGWAHGRGIVHGDVKPGNVFVTRDDGARLLDFGTASPRLEDGGLASVFATPAYASPQVLDRSTPTVADDVFSLGCVAFELLSGVHPFGRVDSREARAKGMRPDEAAPLTVPVRAALEAALSFAPERRPSCMEAFIGMVESGAAAQVPVAPGPTPAGAARRRVDAQRVLGAAAAVLLAGLVVGGMAAWLPRDAGPTAEPRGASRPALPAPGELTPAAAPGEEGSSADGEPPGQVSTVAGGAGATLGAARAPRQAPASSPAMQRVGFERDSLLVSRSAPAAAIPVRRSGGGTGRIAANWRIVEGSARSGRDLAGPLSGTVVLADGQERATVFVPLLEAGPGADDRSFSMVIDRSGGAAGQAPVDRVDVTLRSFVRDEPRSLAAGD